MDEGDKIEPSKSSIANHHIVEVHSNGIWDGVSVHLDVLWDDLPDKSVWKGTRIEWSHHDNSSPGNDLTVHRLIFKTDVGDLGAEE